MPQTTLSTDHIAIGIKEDDVFHNPNEEKTDTGRPAAPPPSATVVNIDELVAQKDATSGGVTILSEEGLAEFSKIVYEDQKWKNGLNRLRAEQGWDRKKAAEFLRQGAKPFGIYALSESSLDGLVNHLMGDPNFPSPALQSWIESKAVDMNHIDMDALANPEEDASVLKTRKLKNQVTMSDKDVQSYSKKVIQEKRRMWKMTVGHWKSTLSNASLVSKFKWSLTGMITVISLAYAFKVVLQMYPDAVEVFGWPVFFARMGGMGCACWTAVLYATMSRTALTWLALRVPCTEVWLTFMDAHKDLHILAAHAMVATAAEHVIMHAIGTVPGLLKASLAELNGLLGCANKHSTPGFFAVDFSALEWPACPVTELPDDFTAAALTTMPGLSGVLLVVLLAAVRHTGKQARRKEHFEHFIYLHNVLVIIWPILLFFHGSQGWIGVGFPLVIFTSSLPILAYMTDRTLRALRYFLYAGTDVQIVSCTVRPGRNGGPDGGLVYLQISQPPRFWKLHSGMYGFLCMPEYARFQWHPFTICSGSDDPTVNFLIAGVGDWTHELVSRAIEAQTEGGRPLPMVGIDGPYTAPTQSALSKDILIAVGAGVGITPFLSLMSTIITLMNDPKRAEKFPLREAHFYWSTRSCDEFLFGRELLSKIVQMPHIRDRVFLHLHCTAKEPKTDAACYMFREAMRRQSRADRAAFEQVFSKIEEKGSMMLTGPQLPWCWVAGSKQDVLWLSHLGHEIDLEAETLAMRQHRGSQGAAVVTTVSGKNAFSLEEVGTQLGRQEIAKGHELMLPVVFGRPDFGTEVRSIGKARPEYDVDIYICGNDAIVIGLQDVAVLCNEHAQRDFDATPGTRRQNYTVHYERFG